MITSTSNPKVKLARKLRRRRHREQEGLCLLEGERLLRDAWQAGVRPHTVFYLPQAREQRPPLHRLLAALEAAGVPVLACTEPVFASMVETVTPQGVLALAPVPRQPLPATVTLALLLDRVRDPGNAGTLLRSAAAAGADLVIFGPETVDPFNGKVLRAAMGAHFRIPLRSVPTWAALEELLPRLGHLYLAEAQAETLYDQVDWRRPSTLVVGGEAAGASPQARAQATPIAIPMANGVESLNAAVAGSVILFEAARQRRVSGHS